MEEASEAEPSKNLEVGADLEGSSNADVERISVDDDDEIVPGEDEDDEGENEGVSENERSNSNEPSLDTMGRKNFEASQMSQLTTESVVTPPTEAGTSARSAQGVVQESSTDSPSPRSIGTPLENSPNTSKFTITNDMKKLIVRIPVEELMQAGIREDVAKMLHDPVGRELLIGQKSLHDGSVSSGSQDQAENVPRMTLRERRILIKKLGEYKAKKIEIHLYVNGVKYEFGCVCTFCQKTPAAFHCKICQDFYCPECDFVNHNVPKRKWHVRKKLSHLNKDAAGRLVTWAVRWHGHVVTLKNKCRSTYRRYFDGETLNHYYYNPVYGTTSWRKPYCVRNEDLFPFLTPEEASTRMIGGLYRNWRARQRCIRELKLQFTKIFDRTTENYYYAFTGKSHLIPQQSWHKPLLCAYRGYPKDVAIMFTPEVAAYRIQRRWRAVLVREFLRELCRCTYMRQWDPVKEMHLYLHKEKDETLTTMPRLMRGQPWDPKNVPEWSVQKVVEFFRRIGLKQYLPAVRDYGVDGRVLCSLNKQDFDNMEIFNKVHIRKIKVELKKIYNKKSKLLITKDHSERRERLVRLRLGDAAATTIQRMYRARIARREADLLRELDRLNAVQRESEEALARSNVWYTSLPELPARRMVGGEILLPLAVETQCDSEHLKRMRNRLNARTLASDANRAHGGNVTTESEAKVGTARQDGMASKESSARDSSSSRLASGSGRHGAAAVGIGAQGSGHGEDLELLALKRIDDGSHDHKLLGIAAAEGQLMFPSIKTFGKSRVHLGAQGWGHRNGRGEWIPLIDTLDKLSLQPKGFYQTGKKKASLTRPLFEAAADPFLAVGGVDRELAKLQPPRREVVRESERRMSTISGAGKAEEEAVAPSVKALMLPAKSQYQIQPLHVQPRGFMKEIDEFRSADRFSASFDPLGPNTKPFQALAMHMNATGYERRRLLAFRKEQESIGTIAPPRATNMQNAMMSNAHEINDDDDDDDRQQVVSRATTPGSRACQRVKPSYVRGIIEKEAPKLRFETDEEKIRRQVEPQRFGRYDMVLKTGVEALEKPSIAGSAAEKASTGWGKIYTKVHDEMEVL